MFCARRHGEDEKTLGAPLCLDCYDHDGQVVWNLHAPELWRRTVNTLIRHLDATVGKHAPVKVRLSYAKVAEYQARGVIHFHALIRLDGRHPDHPDDILPPPPGLGIDELREAIQSAAGSTGFRTDAHPERPGGWVIGWGSQGADVQTIRRGLPGEVTDEQVAGYLAKYATKSTEATGLVAYKITADTIESYAGRQTHPARLIDACWRLGDHHAGADWVRLRQVGAHARLRRALLHPIPPLLHHPQSAASGQTDLAAEHRHWSGARRRHPVRRRPGRGRDHARREPLVVRRHRLGHHRRRRTRRDGRRLRPRPTATATG